MYGSFPAEVAAEIVERRLDEFNVSLEKHVMDCFIMLTDGTAVIVNFEMPITCEHQLYYALGIHMAVCDALYEKNATVISATASEEMRDEDDSTYLSQYELNNPISRKLHEAIIKRIEQRRNSNLVGMLHYLSSGKN